MGYFCISLILNCMGEAHCGLIESETETLSLTNWNPLLYFFFFDCPQLLNNYGSIFKIIKKDLLRFSWAVWHVSAFMCSLILTKREPRDHVLFARPKIQGTRAAAPFYMWRGYYSLVSFSWLSYYLWFNHFVPFTLPRDACPYSYDLIPLDPSSFLNPQLLEEIDFACKMFDLILSTLGYSFHTNLCFHYLHHPLYWHYFLLLTTIYGFSESTTSI